VVKRQETNSSQCPNADGARVAGEQCSFAKMSARADLSCHTGNVTVLADNKFDLAFNYHIKESALFSLLIYIVSLFEIFFPGNSCNVVNLIQRDIPEKVG
jgi:hypothetical protein